MCGLSGKINGVPPSHRHGRWATVPGSGCAIIHAMAAFFQNTFALYLALGSIIGLAWSWQRVYSGNPHRMSARQHESYLEFMALTGLVLLAGGLAGARMGYVFINWNYYQTHTAEILLFSSGGLDWAGAVPGAAICLFFLCGLADRSPLPALADLLPFFTVVLACVWLSASSSAIYYGPVHEPAWWTVTIRDQMSEVHSRLPLALICTLVSATLGIATDLFLPTRLTAVRCEIFAAGQLLLALAASFLRADPVPALVGIPADRFFSILYLIIFVGLAVWRMRLYRKRVVLA